MSCKQRRFETTVLFNDGQFIKESWTESFTEYEFYHPPAKAHIEDIVSNKQAMRTRVTEKTVLLIAHSHTSDEGHVFIER